MGVHKIIAHFKFLRGGLRIFRNLVQNYAHWKLQQSRGLIYGTVVAFSWRKLFSAVTVPGPWRSQPLQWSPRDCDPAECLALGLRPRYNCPTFIAFAVLDNPGHLPSRDSSSRPQEDLNGTQGILSRASATFQE